MLGFEQFSMDDFPMVNIYQAKLMIIKITEVEEYY